MQPDPKTLTTKRDRDIKGIIEDPAFRHKLAATLPRTVSPDRFIRIVFQAFHANKAIERCTSDSLLSCLFKLAAMGLEPDGRRAHLIPYGQECTLVVDYKGIKELIRRNHDVSAMHGDVVGENDEFNLSFGTHGILHHKPNLSSRGKIMGAYSWIKLPDGNEEYDWMSTEEIEGVRRRSKAADKGPWVSDWSEMAKKTVFRRHAKGLPLSPETRDAVDESDGDALTEQERFNAAAPARASVLGGNTAGRARAVRASDLPEPPGDEGEAPEVPKTVSSAEHLANLVGQIRIGLTNTGFTEAELIALMKPLRLAGPNVKTLDECEVVHLERVIAEWDACCARLKSEREKGGTK